MESFIFHVLKILIFSYVCVCVDVSEWVHVSVDV